jgi:hypothetical protein
MEDSVPKGQTVVRLRPVSSRYDSVTDGLSANLPCEQV